MHMQTAREGPHIEAARLLRVVPLSLWPQSIRDRRRRLQAGLHRLEALREEMVATLDLLTPDPDLEPSIGAPEFPDRVFGGQPGFRRILTDWSRGGVTDDREADATSARGPVDADEENMLGSSHVVDQRRWAPRCSGLPDGEEEHDGREPEEDLEHILGWPERISENGGVLFGTDDTEPSLASLDQPDQRRWAEHYDVARVMWCSTDAENEHDGREPPVTFVTPDMPGAAAAYWRVRSRPSAA